MGCGQSSESKEGKQRNEEIENQLKRDKMNLRNEIKMLLLGAGESGKSTILKQMKLIHEGGYSRDERESFREVRILYHTAAMRLVANMSATDHFLQHSTVNARDPRGHGELRTAS
jgi:guanine nucleotide-binding protein G(i) subunit alpha